MIPIATYRLQFRGDFGFSEAAALAPYLAELGISHVYASPYLKARPNSTHGYDITDHNSLNPELGDEAAFSAMIDAFKSSGLTHILDYVPNHMGVGGSDNPFWLDVLEWGESSDYADWFDVDWESHSEYLRGKLLVPFLAAQYGDELAKGKLRLKFDPELGEFAVWAYDLHKLPVSPFSYALILQDDTPELENLRDHFSTLEETHSHVARRASELKKQLAQLVRERQDAFASVKSSVERFHGEEGKPETWSRLLALIRKQHWRPAHFRVAADDINYRRFFNISELAGIRMELPEVFEHTHRFVLGLLRQGIVDGLRIDHIDGLRDPKAYLSRLRSTGGSAFYLIVEKILARHETLRPDWPIQGTTGYEFASQLMQLLVDPAAEPFFNNLYLSFTDESKMFPAIVHQGKIRIMENEMASELHSLAREAARIARQNPTTADFTQNLLYRALKEIVACFPVYRTYVDDSGASETDRRYIHWAIAQALKNEPELDRSIFEFLEKLLTCDLVSQPRNGYSRQSVVSLAMKLQQCSGPVMAKGFEDTALFRFNRLSALNEVGSSPEQFGSPLATFHKENTLRAAHWPHTLLSTSTHDTKHSEDVRARLAALSLVPEEWATRVSSWSRILRARRADVEATAPPSHNDEYLFYQNLVATWPVSFKTASSIPPQELAQYEARLKSATTKSLREARVHTNWVAPNAAYETAVLDFISGALDLHRSEAFFADFLPFQQRIATFGAHNSLVQTVLKLTAPGVPDFYQGCELWDLSLVDPDNRRPVDYAARCRLLNQIEARTSQCNAVRSMWTNWEDGSIKLFLISTLLESRKANPELFAKGSYEPLAAIGPSADKVCAFRRHQSGVSLIVVVSIDARLNDGSFEACHLPVDRSTVGGPLKWRDLLSGQIIQATNEGLSLSPLFSTLPVAALLSVTSNN